MVYVAFALTFVSGMVAMVYLVETGHPWWAFVAALLIAFLQVKKSTEDED